MIQQCWKCRDALFPLPTNSSICYEGSSLRNTDLKLKCESIALLTSVSAFYNSSIRLLCVSCLKLLLWNFCPTLYQMCLHVTNISTKVTCMMGKTLFQCNRKIHSAKLDDLIYGMLSVIKSAAVAWDLCHGSHRHTRFQPWYSQTWCSYLLNMKYLLFPTLECLSKRPWMLFNILHQTISLRSTPSS